METLKNRLHSEIISTSKSFDAASVVRNEVDYLLAKALYNSLYDFDLATEEEIGKIIFKLRFSMATEKHSEKEWEIITSLYIEALSDKDRIDILNVAKEYIAGHRGKFMPKPSEFAEACIEEKDYRRRKAPALRCVLRKTEKYKPNLSAIGNETPKDQALRNLFADELAYWSEKNRG